MDKFPSFPLYYSIKKICQNNDLSREEKQYIVDNISFLSSENKENIYALIRAHSVETSQNRALSVLPYSGKHTSINSRNGIHFNIDNLPVLLKRMIHTYVRKTITYQQEERDIQQQRDIVGATI